jgi:transposase InsO family protein
MPWKEADVVDLREEFVAEVLKKHLPVALVCEHFGISRKTGHKWLQRFLEGGRSCLVDRSRRPLHMPWLVREEAAAAIVELRKLHPLWGPRKLRIVLRDRQPDERWPAASTIGLILKQRGLVLGRRRRLRTPYSTQPLASATEPNVVWTGDFKGCFRVGGRYCHPLTIGDACSRYLLRVQGLEREKYGPVKEVFESAFREYGLPLRIRTDNGSPFASKALGGLSKLSVWWVRLGILPERILPGHPEQNGRHERMHRTLKAHTARPPRRTTEEQQAAFDDFRKEFNQERPHEALGQRTPASCYTSSPRTMPEELPDPEYPEHFEIKRAYKTGHFCWKGIQFVLGRVLQKEAIGLEPISDGRWQLWFGPVYLGLLCEEGRGKHTFIRNKQKTNSNPTGFQSPPGPPSLKT